MSLRCLGQQPRAPATLFPDLSRETQNPDIYLLIEIDLNRTLPVSLIHEPLFPPQSCCVAAACLSRTRDLETHLAPLATTLVELNLPNEASVDCVAFFLQVRTAYKPAGVSRGHQAM